MQQVRSSDTFGRAASFVLAARFVLAGRFRLAASFVLAGRSNLAARLRRGHSRLVVSLAILLCAALAPVSNAQEFVWAPDFPVGSRIPDITSLDQHGVVRDYDSIKGDRGVIFLINRSFDW